MYKNIANWIIGNWNFEKVSLLAVDLVCKMVNIFLKLFFPVWWSFIVLKVSVKSPFLVDIITLSFQLESLKRQNNSSIQTNNDRKTYCLGENVATDFLQGGVVEILSNLIGKAAHRFLGVDPNTGRIIGAVAGNVLFQLGGKDNKLSDVGKIILDNIVSGKYRRKVSFIIVL